MNNLVKGVNKMVLEDPIFERICHRLHKSNVSSSLIQEMRTKVLSSKMSIGNSSNGFLQSHMIQGLFFEEMMIALNERPKVVNPYKTGKGHSKVIICVEPDPEFELTTTCAQLAYYYKLQGWTSGIICTDACFDKSYEKLKQSASSADIPFYESKNVNPSATALAFYKMLVARKIDYIIVNASFRQCHKLFLEKLLEISKVLEPYKIVLVTSASSARKPLEIQIQALKENKTAASSVIVSNINNDGSNGGCVLNIADATGLPITFTSRGEEDFEAFRPSMYIGEILLGENK